MNRYTFTVYFINGAGYNRSTLSIQEAYTLREAENAVYHDFQGSELADENPVRLMSIQKLKYRDYTSWLVGLIGVILADNKDMTINNVALEDYLKPEFYDKGIHPAHLYHYIWEGDAGNYWGI